MQDQLDAAIGQIARAFAGVPRGAITLHEAEVIDSYGSSDERKKARQLDIENRWQDVPSDHIRMCVWALAHLDPLSWRYYLPAYMTWSLRNARTDASVTCDMTIYSLEISNPALRDYHLERFRTLSQQQSSAVVAFLDYAKSNGDVYDSVAAERALLKYWESYRGFGDD